ncbi:hypothetical protein LCGC14_2883680 [marine sediment metagenome]|uniref:Uncharacterized protein n=1 Tax=marine sediment metagenome TaxID=412755 RepID=A0A0F8XZD8_9ZZZZ
MTCDDCHVVLGSLYRVVGKVKRRRGKITKRAGIYCNKCAGIRLGERNKNGRLTDHS